MPHRNGRIKQKFTTFYNRVEAMLNGGKVSFFLRYRLWTEAANTKTLLENNLVTTIRQLSPFQQFHGNRKYSILTSLQKFGEICVMMHNDIKHMANLSS